MKQSLDKYYGIHPGKVLERELEKRQYLLQATDRTGVLKKVIGFCEEGRDANGQDQVDKLKMLALSINPNIGFDAKLPVVAVVIGKTRIDRSFPTFYIGSKGWDLGFFLLNRSGQRVPSTHSLQGLRPVLVLLIYSVRYLALN